LGNIGMVPQKPQKVKKLNLETFSEFDLPVPSPVYQPKPEEDYQKLQQLFVTIQELDKQNRNLTLADLEALNIHGVSDSLLTKGPDPLTYNEYDVSKNEVKRQEADFSGLEVGSTTEESPTRVTLNFGTQGGQTVEEEIVEETIVTKQDKNKQTLEIVTPTPAVEFVPELSPVTEAAPIPTTVAEVITTTTTPRPATTTTATTTPSQADTAARANSLADSFPKITGPVVEVALPPPRRNGFYFYSDWNTFLEVGEEPNKVVIRFDPKIGDPSRFLEVNIPSKIT
jgi:hypothetical protein